MSAHGAFTAALIAGGESSRMGQDKAFLEVGGRPLWRLQLDLLARLAPSQVILSANAAQQFPELPDAVTLVRDPVADGGPLSGLAAVLGASRQARVLVIAVDMPRLAPDFLAGLLGAEGAVVYRHDGGRFEPFPAVYPTAAAPAAWEALRAGRLALQDFLRDLVDAGSMAAWPVGEDAGDHFRSWNRPSDIAAIPSDR